MNPTYMLVIVFTDDNGTHIKFRLCRLTELQSQLKRYGPDVKWHGLARDFFAGLGACVEDCI